MTAMSGPDLEAAPAPVVVSAARQLYDCAPDLFIARRKELASEAKANGDKDAAAQIGRLRKPDVAAWAINRTVRSSPEVAADLVGLGARMRAAQAALDVDSLQQMRTERDAAVTAFVGAAFDAVAAEGRRLGAAGQEAVRATAIAVLADAGASDAVASALLTKPLSYSGFGEVDLSDAVAVTGSGVVLTALSGGGEGGQAATSDPSEVSGTGRKSDDTTREAKAEAARLERAREAVREAEEEEARAREQVETTGAALEDAEEELAEARRRYEQALRAAEAARAADADARAAVSSAVRSRRKAEARLR